MPLSLQEELEMLELEKSRSMAMSAPIPEHKTEEHKTFMQGIKAGLTAQPGEGVGHFIGAMAPATIGATIGSAVPVVGTAIGASLGEAARQTAGAIVNPEDTANKSKLGIFAEVAGAGVGQKAGEAMGPIISKAGEGVKSVSEWLTSKIGKSFLKAGKKLNAYGHLPEKAIQDEGIVAYSWDDLVSKAKAAKHDIGEAMDDLISKSDKDIITNADDVVAPIDTALEEAYKFPTGENTSLITRLEGLKKDTLALLNKGAKKGEMLNVERANNVKKSLYKVTKYAGTDADEIPLNKVKQDVARNIAKKIEEVTPEIKPLNDRYGNVIALENAAVNRAIVANRNDIFGLPEMLGLGVAGVGGAAGIGPAAGIVLGNRLLKSPLGATAAISGLSSGVIDTAIKGAEVAAKGVGKIAGGVTAAMFAKGLAQEAQDHPTIPPEYLPHLVNDGPVKDPNSYNKSTTTQDRTPHDIKADYKSGRISKEQAVKELQVEHGFE